MKTFNNIEEILDSAEFNDMFNIELEIQELAQSGWTMSEVMSFAKSMAKKK